MELAASMIEQIECRKAVQKRKSSLVQVKPEMHAKIAAKAQEHGISIVGLVDILLNRGYKALEQSERQAKAQQV